MLFTDWLVAVVDIAIWGITVRLTKTASIASMLLVVITPPLLIWRGVRGVSLIWVFLIIGLVVWRHRGNIQRMIRGREEKVPT